jgi:acyl CoA:acetate/3-ketoacid CoA transferase
VGVGTFLDPRVDIGSALTPNAGNQFVKADGDALIYSMPRVEIAIMNAPYADADGNIYFTNAASLTESLESAHAARANGGKVLVTVSAVGPKNEAQIALRAHEVDAVVVHPYNEQTASVPQSRYWPMFTEGSKVHAPAAIEKLRYINNVLKITPVRGPVEFVLARLGATMLCRMVGPGAMVNIGVGFPEEVARQLVDHGLYDQLLFSTEAGAYGGLPAPGIFFSAAISPQHLESSAATFHRYANGLDAAILGFLQVDSAGNVNASHRGPRITDTVGPGGFPDIAAGARNIVFVGSWMAGANMVIENGKIRMVKPGTCKFVSQVDHITFNAAEALRMGKQVYYVTHVGVFELTEQGIALRQVMPGIDIQKDIVEASTANIVVPFQEPVPLVNSSVLTGGHFTLQLKNQAMATA